MSNNMYYKPKANEGDVLYDINNKKYYLVEGVEPLGSLVKDFGSIGAGAKLEAQEVSDIYVEEGYIAEMRMLPIDDIRVYIRVPRQSIRGALKNKSFYVDKYIADNIWYHPLTEIWVAPEQKFWVDVENPDTTNSITTSRVRFVGWLYKVREITPEEASGKTVVRFRRLTIAIGATS